MEAWGNGGLRFMQLFSCRCANRKTFIDKQDILIGEQLNYKVVATFPEGAFNVRTG